jgi:uncharacterized protein (TIGR03437 family)
MFDSILLMNSVRRLCPWFVFLLSNALWAQAPRIDGRIDATSTVELSGGVHPLARPDVDLGAADPSLKLGYITMVLKPTAAQQASLEALLVQQQDRTSANYHKWLTPEQFGERFGMAASDLSAIQAWLVARGFKIEDTARGRNWIAFSGTAGQVNQAFHAGIHRYQVRGKLHYANSLNPSLPPQLAAVVRFFRGLDDFDPEPASISHQPVAVPDFSNAAGVHSMAPDDFATIYDIVPLYNSNINGTGQSIAVLGRTDIDLAGYQTFRSLYNLPPTLPVLHLVGTDPGLSDSDLSESMLDLEWSGAVARNATIIFVYATSINTAAQEAVDKSLAPVITSSYSSCEADSADTLRYLAQQANAQGITWLVVTNDSGAAACFDHHSGRQLVSTGYGVSYPGSIPEITAVGGAEFQEGSGTYWSASNGPNGGSALSYIPEIGWNDSGTAGIASSGGGVSIFYSKPAWQAGPGVPNDHARDLPDISMAASWSHDGYRIYYNSTNFINGGTSAATPALAGVMALLNQYQVANGLQATSGMGNINPELYRLAQSYPAAFHDITSGNNIVPCVQSSPNCLTGSFGYTAGPGYDLVTGIGTVDVNNLITHWNQNGDPSKTTVTATPSTAAFDTMPQLKATVTAASGSTVPTGTVAFLIPDEGLGTIDLGTAALATSGSSATATVSVSPNQLAPGLNNITAVYSGDNHFDVSSGTTALTVTPAANAAAIVVSCSPNPVYAASYSNLVPAWKYSFTLTNQSSVAATVTDFTIGGVDEASRLTTFFASGTTIPANGTLTAGVTSTGEIYPGNVTFTFSGVDAKQNAWSQQITVAFVAPLDQSAMLFTVVPTTVQPNPAGGTSCPWMQKIFAEELGGYNMQLTKFVAGSNDFSSQISQYFGTTQIAPFGVLEATLCSTGSAAPTAFQLGSVNDGGGTWNATSTVAFSSVSIGPGTLAASPASIALSTASASGSASAALSLTLAGGASNWTAAIFPGNLSTSWLTISATSGTASGSITLTANAAGQAPGVYRARVIVQASSANPQFLEIPVTFTVGASSSISIAGVAQGASFKTQFAPGMILSVFGSGLAPGTQAASAVPLSLSMQGVSATVNGIAAPLYYVSPTQINLQIPYETGAGPAVVGINNNGAVASFPFTTTPTAPGIFVASGNLVPTATASPGGILVLFMTGEGDVTPELVTGASPSASTAIADLPAPRLPVTVTVGGIPATILFEGIPPALVGVTQINFVVPSNVPAGVQPVVVTSNGVSSPAANITVTAN